jgi:hypothetical protein
MPIPTRRACSPDPPLIVWLAGERWFCDENAAMAAGWRKARI